MSNPPFSVEGFHNSLGDPSFNFELYQGVSEKSNEIECFFIERTLQLLKPGGCAGILLPLSILSNDKTLYDLARKVIVSRSKVVAMVEMREKAFPATNTSVIILFLRKRFMDEYSQIIEDMRASQVILGTEVKSYIQEAELLFSRTPNRDFSAKQLMILRQCLCQENIVLGFSGENKQQEHFLGYRISRARGREGIHESGVSILSGSKRDDEKSLSYIIKSAFLNDSNLKLDEAYSEYTVVKCASDMIYISEGEGVQILPPSSIFAKSSPEILSLHPKGDFIEDFPFEETSLTALTEAGKVSVIKGLTYDKNADEVPRSTSTWILTASNIDLSTGQLIFGRKIVYLKDTLKIDADLLVRPGDIVMSMNSGSLAHLGKVAYVSELDDAKRIAAGGFLTIIRARSVPLAKALYCRFLSKVFREYIATKKGQNINNLNIADLRSFELKVPKDLAAFEKRFDELLF